MTIMRMKAWSRMVILVASTLVSSIAFAAPSAIDYGIRRLPDGDRYEVTLRFEGDRGGRSTLTIPTSWVSAAHAERGIEGLEVMTAQARLEDTDQPQVKRVVHRPGATVVVRYRLKQIATGEPSVTDPAAMFLPVIRPHYFAWVGWTSWVIPMADNDRRVRVRVAFSGLPSDWEFASSFGLDAGAIAYDGPMFAFQAAYFIGGDFRLRSRPARGGPIITAIRGDWSFTDHAFADRVATVVDGERAFWRDDTQRYYLVTLMPLDTPPGSPSRVAGTGLTKGFMTQAPSNLPLDRLDFLWTHEYFHTWNNGELGRFPEPQAQLYWFSEGFTDYYMNLLQLRLGLQSLDQYARAYDEAIASLAESPEVHASNSEVVKRFVSDGDTIGRLPYWRGMLLAAQWDAQIRAASSGRRSLDDAMRTLRDEHRHGVEVLDAARIVRVMRSYGVTDAETDIASQIERGEAARLADGTLTSCISVDDASTPRADIGFDLRGSTRGGPIIGVDRDGPAYAAGLRNGQFLRTFVSIDRQEHLVEAGYQETSDNDIRTVRYRALGQPVTRQRIVVRAGLDDEARQRCLKTLGLR